MKLEQALKATGFERCEFKADCDECEECGKPFRKLFWMRTDYWENEGVYLCARCVKKMAYQISQVIDIKCPQCGNTNAGYPHEKGRPCFDCFASTAESWKADNSDMDGLVEADLIGGEA